MSDDKNQCIYEEDEDMNATMERQGYNKLDFSKLNFSPKPISSNEALSDVTPFQWSDDVINGKKKVVIKNTEDK